MTKRTVNKLFAGAMALTVAMTPLVQPMTAFAAESAKNVSGEVKGTYTGTDPVGQIGISVNCNELQYTYDLSTSTWTTDKKNFRVIDECKNTEFLVAYETSEIGVSYTPEAELAQYAVGTLFVGEDELGTTRRKTIEHTGAGLEYTLQIANGSQDKKAANEAIKKKLGTEDTLGKIGTIRVDFFIGQGFETDSEL